MEHFTSIMERDYGFKSGKNAPMVGSPGGSSGGGGYSGVRKSVPGTRMSGSNAVYGQDDPFGLRKSEGSKPDRGYGSRDDLFSPAPYDDVFGGPPKSAGTGARYDDTFASPARGGPVDDLLGGYSRPASKVKSTSSSFQDSPRRSDRNHAAPSEPVFDEDELVPGFGFMPKSRVFPESKPTDETDPFGFSSADTLPSRPPAGSGATFDDDGLLSGFDSGKSRTVPGDAKSSRQSDPLMPIFDDPVPSGANHAYNSFGEDGLLPGFGREGNKSRSFRDADASSPARDSFRPNSEDPGLSNAPGESPPFDDLLNVFNEPQVPPSTSSSRGPGNGIKPDRLDSFDSFPSSPGNSGLFKDTGIKPTENADRSEGRNATGSPEEAPSAREGFTGDDIDQVSPDSDPFFPSQSESLKSGTGLGTSEKLGKESPSWDAPVSNEPQGDPASGSKAQPTSDDIIKVAKEWLTVDDIKLMTRPTRLPPPSRRPPPIPGTGSRSGTRDKFDALNANFVTSSATLFSEDDLTGNSSAKHVAPPSYEQAVPGWKDFNFQSPRDEEREREARAAKERRRQEREEARLARDRDAREKEIRQAKDLEIRQAKEQERLRREKERERDKVRLATLEARERAAQESKERADRMAVDRANGEARERAASQARERARVEKAAVERATTEARERAAAEAREAREREGRDREARERAAAENRERERDRVATENRERERTAIESREREGRDKAAAEARDRAQMKAAVERASGEVRERAARVAAEKAAVERAQTEARERAARAAAEKAAVERAAAEARERASRAAAEKNARERAQQQRKSENDLESFFANSGSSSAPNNDSKPRPASMNNSSSSTNVFGEPRRTMSGTATTTASVDDWTSMLTDETQGRRGEAGKATKAQTDRYEHTRQRAAKAIAEIKQRDLETQREQAEKQRAGEVLDSEIKRWAAGKEGNLRALLSTLQYVLWPECGWTPVSLTDLISPASVKKTYRKAALYVHPDKVQQKGATVQQKYIAEKVFDLLKEAFNKFNSEEFF